MVTDCVDATAPSIDPEFDSMFTNVTAINGETATLPCAITSLGKFKVSSFVYNKMCPFMKRIINCLHTLTAINNKKLR